MYNIVQQDKMPVITTTATVSNATLTATNSTFDCAKLCPCGVPIIPVPEQWLEVVVTGGFKVWHIMFIIIAFIITMVVFYCCAHRCRIPRTKQEIEADLMRSTLAGKFRDYLQDFPNEPTTFIEALKRVQDIEEKLQEDETQLSRDLSTRKRLGWLKMKKDKDKDKEKNQEAIEAADAATAAAAAADAPADAENEALNGKSQVAGQSDVQKQPVVADGGDKTSSVEHTNDQEKAVKQEEPLTEVVVDGQQQQQQQQGDHLQIDSPSTDLKVLVKSSKIDKKKKLPARSSSPPTKTDDKSYKRGKKRCPEAKEPASQVEQVVAVSGVSERLAPPEHQKQELLSLSTSQQPPPIAKTTTRKRREKLGLLRKRASATRQSEQSERPTKVPKANQQANQLAPPVADHLKRVHKRRDGSAQNNTTKTSSNVPPKRVSSSKPD